MKLARLILCAMLLAPLAPGPAQAITSDELNKLYNPYAADSQTALDQPHRSAAEIGSWVSEMVSMALDFMPNKAGKQLIQMKPFFTDQGYNGFIAFLNGLGLGDAMQKQQVTMDAIVNTVPTPIGQGASAGRYAWAFELPVVLSISTVPNQPQTNRNVVLRIQVGRSNKGADPHNVLIESWQEYRDGTQYAPAPQPKAGAPVQGTVPGGAQGGGKPAGTP